MRALIALDFGADTNPRYSPSSGYTYCNVFAGDVARAMDAPLLTKEEYLGKRGDPATINAYDLFVWFTTQSSGRDWREINPYTTAGLNQLIAHVNAGKLAMATNTDHVAVIRPGQGSPSTTRDLRVAQAGATNASDISLGQGFGSSANPPLLYPRLAKSLQLRATSNEVMRARDPASVGSLFICLYSRQEFEPALLPNSSAIAASLARRMR